jgi:hypothetical protein
MIGTKLGSLEITSLLGKGGMGEVYRARDTKDSMKCKLTLSSKESICGDTEE